MWETWVHKQDETVVFEAQEDGEHYEVRPVRTAGPDQREDSNAVASWRVTKETFLNIYERKV